jgi:hypothetical protein
MTAISITPKMRGSMFNIELPLLLLAAVNFQIVTGGHQSKQDIYLTSPPENGGEQEYTDDQARTVLIESLLLIIFLCAVAVTGESST